jgi:hypothetical protein
VLAGIKAEQAEVDLDVTVGGLQAAQGQDAGARPAQGIAIRVDAGQLESAVSFHRGADIGGPAGVDIEAAIGQLAFEDGAGGLPDAHGGGRIPGVVFGLMQNSCSRM